MRAHTAFDPRVALARVVFLPSNFLKNTLPDNFTKLCNNKYLGCSFAEKASNGFKREAKN
jgi:predicted adenine nucleotide alpha hydrolase (AANH) superfamily ATPase